MAKLTLRSEINVGVELIIDEPARTIQLVATGNLVAKDGAAFQAVYGKFVDLWATATYQDSPFPFNALDALSGQYLVGVDAGGNYNGWKWLDDATRDMVRDGGWDEYDNIGTLNRVYVGIVGLGIVNLGSQPYYIRDAADAPLDFAFDDQVNVGVQVYGDAANGDFDKRIFFKSFVREQGYKYKSSVLLDTGKTATGAYIVNMLLSNESDGKITDLDAEMVNAPYDGVTIEYFGSDQLRDIGGSDYPFRIIVSNTGGATLAQIYTKLQYLMRQDTDVDTGLGTVIGSTADVLTYFDGDTLVTNTGVYVDDVLAAESNSIIFYDQNDIARENLYEAAGVMAFNAIMVGGGSSYRMMFTTGPGAGDDYGEAGAITCKNASLVDITGTIATGSIDFTFDYDGDALGGDPGTDKPFTLIGIRPNSSKFAVATGVFTRSKNISVSLVAETDRAYL